MSTLYEEYVLPSKGKVYAQEVNPVIRLRSMTTNDEMKRLSISNERPYLKMCEIIDDCMMDDPGISSYDMCIGDYQFLLHKLRVVTYGSEYKIATKCPYCECTSSETINLESLAVKEYSEDINKYFEFDLPVTGHHIRLRMQTPRILDETAYQSKELSKKVSNANGEIGDTAFLFSIQNLIDTIDGQPIDPVNITEMIRNLPMKDTNMIMNYAKKLNEGVGLDTSFEVDCDICGLAYTSNFRTTSEFFGPTMDI